MPQYLMSVVDEKTGSATAAEMAATDAFTEQLEAEGHWVFAGGLASQQIHLDLYVTDPPAAHEHALAVGARLAQPADLSTAAGFEVYTDPAGHPFCLCWG